MSRRVAIVFFVIGFLFLLVPTVVRSLRFESTPTNPKRTGSLTLPIPVRMVTLDPQKVLSYPEKSLVLLFFSRLIQVDEDFQIQPDLLESWSYDVPSSRIHFTLRKDVLFHDGTPLTTDDVLFSFHQWAKKQSLDSDLLLPVRGVPEYQNGQATTISGLHKVSTHGFSIELRDWIDSFVRVLALPRFCVYPTGFKGRAGEDFFKHPVGSGPFEVAVYQPEASSFKAFSKFYLGPPMTEFILTRYIPEEQALEEFEVGTINNLIMYDVSPRESYARDPDIIISKLRSTNTLALINQARLPSMHSLVQRQNVADYINKKTLAQRCFRDSMVAQNFIPPGMMGGPPTTSVEVSDKPKSPIPGPVVPLYIPAEDPSSQCMLDYLKISFAGTPIQPALAAYEDLYVRLKQRQLHLWIELLQFKSEDPLGTLQYFSSTSNEYLLSTPIKRLQQLFFTLSHTTSEFNRAAVYSDIDRYLVSNSYVSPLVHLPRYSIARREVKGLESLIPKRLVSKWHKVYVQASHE